MSKNVRQRISHAIRTTFRLSPEGKQTSSSSSTKSKVTSCCSVNKSNDYECVSYQPKQTPTKHDYIDLSECHSWSLSYSKDSGISFDSNEHCHPLQSTRIDSDHLSSLSTLSNLSSIPHDPIPTRQSSCHCQCHRYINNNQLFGGINHYSYTSKQMKTKIYPFIF